MNTTFAQLDFRLTAAYGNIYIRPQTDLNMHIKAENYITIGFQADYYFTEKIGIGAGADYYVKDSQFDVILSSYAHSYSGTDNWEVDPYPRDYVFTIRSNVPDIVERNTLSFIEVPVSVVYSFPLYNNVYLTSRLGAKAGIPLTDSYILNESDLFTRLYFPEWDLELFEIPAHGLYDSRTDWHPEGELKLNEVYSVFTEVGLDFPISPLKVRVSGYFSYALNDMIREKESSLIYWREEYNNVLSITESTRIIQIGIKVGIGIMSHGEKKGKYKDRSHCAWETACIDFK
ncbi:hypothetical protein [uncultured Draconibacterium sp.]|uniref:hypothetical protein n=1 Tax=uncultured Draconibacterium sp. TaxID=1573823 RepID=UPI0029C8D5ED|nr:hypothetical protein [uncultured Draconibacterium sp.]